jgi:hypothetical protein
MSSLTHRRVISPNFVISITGASRLLAPLPRGDRTGLAFLGHLWLAFLRHAALNLRAEACWTEVKPSRVGRVEGV